MNILEDAAHPGVVADVFVWYTRPAKGVEDIDDDALHIHVKMLVQQLDVRHTVGADVLIGIIKFS